MFQLSRRFFGSDGALAGNPGNSSCGGVFRNSEVTFCGGFAIN
jgi:hypothetical protein